MDVCPTEFEMREFEIDVCPIGLEMHELKWMSLKLMSNQRNINRNEMDEGHGPKPNENWALNFVSGVMPLHQRQHLLHLRQTKHCQIQNRYV